MKDFYKKNKLLIIVLIVNLFILIFYPQIGKKSLLFTSCNLINFFLTLSPVFICVGLLDVWIDKETMIRIAGENSGLKGILISFLLGVATAIPMYALLPVAGVLLKKNSKISNVLIFICSSASIRIPLLLFEISALGLKFTMIRFIVNIFAVIIISGFIDKLLSVEDKTIIYDNSGNF